MPSEVKHPSPQTPTLTTYSCITAARSSYVATEPEAGPAGSARQEHTHEEQRSCGPFLHAPGFFSTSHWAFPPGLLPFGAGVLCYRGAAAGPHATEAPSAQQCQQGAGAEGLSLTHRGAAWSPAPSRALPSLIKTLTTRHA